MSTDDTMNELERKEINAPNELRFNSDGLIPAIVQDSSSGDVLMLAFMNEASLNKTIETGLTWFYSRSRQKLWQKGETSGNVQRVREIRYDCDLDTLLIKVDQSGPACHTGKPNCFYRTLGAEQPEHFDLHTLFEVIKERKQTMPEGSYTSQLFREGRKAITAKIDEESEEVIDAAFHKTRPDLIWESADLIYHLLVLLVNEKIELDDVVRELAGRHKPSK